MALIDMVMPKMGESIMECTVIAWLKQPGDRIEIDESVLEVATDKVDTEVPAPQNGILKEILVHNGDVVAVGAPIAASKTEMTADTEPTPVRPTDADQTPVGIGDIANLSSGTNGMVAVDSSHAISPTETEEVEVSESARELETSISAMSTRNTSLPQKAVAASPTTLAVDAPVLPTGSIPRWSSTLPGKKALARDELDRIVGTGAGGRLTKKDILAYVMDRVEGSSTTAARPDATPEPQTMPVPAAKQVLAQHQTTPPNGRVNGSVNGQSDVIQMGRMRKMIAQ